MYLQILECQTNTLLAQQAWYVLKHLLLYYTNLLHKRNDGNLHLILESKIVALWVNNLQF